jgi:YidC/Oxa1 family membrane protein insertase
MSDQVRGIIFVLVALIILFVWQHFYKPAVPPPQSASAPAAQSMPATGAGAGATATPGQKSVAPAVSAPTRAASPAVAQATDEKTISVDSAFYHVELSNRGAVVRSWTLQKYFDDQKPPHPLDLVNSDSARQLGWPFSLQLSNAEDMQQANSALYEVNAAPPREEGEPAAAPAAITTSSLRAPVEITFHWSDGHLDITKKLIFRDDYEMSAEVSAALDGKPLQVALAWRGGFGDKEVYKASSLVSVYYNQGGKLSLLQYKKLGVSGNQAQPAQQVGPLEYAGIEDQFFTAAFLPEGTDLSEWHWTENHNITEDGKPATEPTAEMAVGSAAPGPLKARIFVGPKDLDILGKLRPPLEDLVQFGWTGIIAKPLLYSLRWLHKYIPNYGWAIVVLTLVINFALFPLKMKSWRSMQKMQKVAPEVRSIQDRYKKYSMSDPRKKKMNEEVMAIYQREGINPMGSCLPMLFQMPIWWALWRVLNGAIELRHAVWLGWIHDLSAKDPYYILPILMTITMYLTTKMTPQTSIDPTQQRMQQLMPLMFAVIFFNLSSGLNLYMFTSNMVAVGQQVYLNRTEPLPDRSKFKSKKKE